MIAIIAVVIFLIIGYLYRRGVRYDRYVSRHRAPYSQRLGDAGETAVSSILQELPREYELFNDVIFQYNNRSTQIDHIVVSKYGLFVIETKNMAGPIYGSENAEFWSEYLPETRFENKEYRFRNPIWQNEGHIKALRAVLQDSNVPIYGIVVFPRGTELKINAKSKVTTYNNLCHFIRLFDEPEIDTDTVLKYSAMIGEANMTGPTARQNHLQSVRENKARRNALVAEGRCPRCGGRLIEREGGYGRFLGCSNYPKCKYTLKQN